MNTRIPATNGSKLEALQGFLKSLLTTGTVQVVLTPMRTGEGTVAPALVSNPDLLSKADPLAPVLPVNAATLVGKLSARQPRPKVAAVMRSCELRALVELTKMQQASLDDLLLVAVDCAGAYGVKEYQQKIASGNPQEKLWADLFSTAGSEHEPEDLRAACQVCEQPVFPGAHIAVHLIGSHDQDYLEISAPDDLAEKLGLAPAPTNGREAALQNLISARTARRDEAFSKLRGRLEGEEGLAGVFSACIRCHNCMTVCPICYCKTCVFKSQLFDHEPQQYLGWANQKGALRMPADTVLFHLTRLNHMGLSCVGCGVCSEACPVELPVGLTFRAIGQRLQDTFDYLPGRSQDEPLPLITFKADEWNEVGE
jgi:formate dehydrogenase (coenzyme F420) beta subunit